MADNSLQGGTDTIRDLARQAGTIKTQVMQIDIGGATGNAEVLVTAGQQTMAASLPVVIASNQTAIPVLQNDVSASGSLAAAAQTVVLALNGQSAASVQLSGTWVGTVTFEGSNDGTNWTSVNAVAATTSQPQPTATVNGLYRLTPGGLMQLRANMTAFTSGSATVSMRASAGTGGIFANQILPTKMTDGTNTATIKAASTAAVAGDSPLVVTMHPSTASHPVTTINGLVSTVNSSATALGASAVFTGTSEDLTEYATIVVSVFADQASATDGLQMQQSTNGTNWDIVDSYTIPANTGKTFSLSVTAKFYRVVYTNGTTINTVFRLQSLFHKSSKKSSSVRPQDGRTNDNDFEENLAFGMVYNGTTWDRLRGSAANGLSVSQSDIIGSGSITTQNLVPAGVATAGSAIELTLLNSASLSIQVTGTYTGALSLQATIDGTNWLTLGGTPFINVATSAYLASITSALQGIFQAQTSGFIKARITALAAVTGTATVSLRAINGESMVALTTGLPTGANTIGKVDFTPSAIVGIAASIAALNTDLLTGVVSGWYDASSWRSATIQIIGGAGITAGALALEQTNDITNAPAGNNWVFEEISITSPIILSGAGAITPAASSLRIYSTMVQSKYVRLRVSTAFAGGTVQASVMFSQQNYFKVNQTISQQNAGSFNAQVNGTASVGSAAANNPIQSSGQIRTINNTIVTDGVIQRFALTTSQQLLVKPYGLPELDWQATSGLTALATTTSTPIKAAGAAGIRNYVTAIQVYNTSATVSTLFTILDGATVLYTGYLPAITSALPLVPANIPLPTPLRSTAATAINIQLATTAANVYWNAQGYQGN